MKISLLLILFFLSACGKPGKLFFEAPPEEVNFGYLKSNLIEDRCVGCHQAFADEERLLNFVNGNDPDTSRLYLAPKEGKMPPKGPPLTSEELELIRNYIVNLKPRAQREIAPQEVDFKVLETHVLDKCITCHKRYTSEEGFARHLNGNDPETSKFYLAVKEGRMPKNSPKLSDKELEIVRNFILNRKTQDQ